jgi:UDP-glucose:(heptosyl)LPS alpha-1,3-glucosyltransferase
MVREEILRYYETPGSRVQVIYTGVDLDRFHPERWAATRVAFRESLGVGSDDPVVLFAGSGFERKGLRFLLEAAGRLRGLRGLRIWVLGKGNPRRMRALATRQGIADRVHLAGPVTDPERWMAAADLFVLPTIYDPFSNACLEAMASGLPVITTAANGVAEIIEEGRSGAVISDPRDAPGLADRMADFLDPARREERRLATRTAAEAFPVAEHVKRVLALYEEVVQGVPA